MFKYFLYTYEDTVNNTSNRIKQLPIRGEDEIA